MAGVSGRMGTEGGLRTGWLAAFGTEGYEGEPGLMEELGVNFGHIKTKVSGRCLINPRAMEEVRLYGGKSLGRTCMIPHTSNDGEVMVERV